MSLTADDLKRRKSYIGASDAPAILGAVPQRNAADVYYEKTNPKVDPWDENLDDFDPDAMETGHLVEPMLLNWAAEKAKVDKFDYQLWIPQPEGVFAATFDGLGYRDTERIVLEAKSSGIGNPWFNRIEAGWGDPGTDQVPEKVRIQVHVQMMIAEAKIAYVPALLGGDGGMRLYRVEYDPGFARIIDEVCTKFWHENVLKGVPPDVPPSEDTLKEMDRVEDKAVELPDDLLSEYLRVKDEAKALSDKESELRRELLAKLGDAEIGESPSGRITYKAQSRTSIDTTRLKKEWPELYDKFSKTTTYRVLRTKSND